MLISPPAAAALELAAATEIGRGSAALSASLPGGLAAAARSLTAAERLDVVIVTGFFLPRADPPTAETDGPVGAAQLAAAVEALGGTATLVTDEPCADIVRTAADAASVRGPVLAAPVGAGFATWLDAALGDLADTTHVVSIERVGPGADGIPRNMRGQDISAHTAPLEQLFLGLGAHRIAIGDGGNEIGMGILDPAVVADVVNQGELVRCVTGCDDLVIAGTSNWGAQALVGAMAQHRDHGLLAELLTTDWNRAVLEAIVAAGAADGVSLVNEATVDSLSRERYESVLAELAHLSLPNAETISAASVGVLK